MQKVVEKYEGKTKMHGVIMTSSVWVIDLFVVNYSVFGTVLTKNIEFMSKQEAFRERRHLHIFDLWHVSLTL